jgi:Raf kinase inhibitor-like YbhB/YbcL family protein
MRTFPSASALAVMLCISASAARAQNPAPAAAAAPRPPAMALVSSAWADGDPIPLRYTQGVAAPVSPPLSWTNTPANTASFVLFMHDPDVAMARGTDDVVHWLVWNIPGSATSLPEAVPEGATLANGARQTSVRGNVFTGPGAGANGPVHHYTFELFALDTMLDVQPAATPLETKAAVYAAMKGHVLGKAVYVGLFKRPS